MKNYPVKFTVEKITLNDERNDRSKNAVQVTCCFNQESNVLQLNEDEYKYLRDIAGVSASLILMKQLKQIPFAGLIDDSYIKLFGQELDDAISEAAKKIEEIFV